MNSGHPKTWSLVHRIIVELDKEVSPMMLTQLEEVQSG